MDKDYAKEANQLHIVFHRNFLDVKEKDKRAIRIAHDLFDTLVLWIEEMQKEIYKLQGALEYKERVRLENVKDKERIRLGNVKV